MEIEPKDYTQVRKHSDLLLGGSLEETIGLEFHGNWIFGVTAVADINDLTNENCLSLFEFRSVMNFYA
jgi:hypothetical protein